MNKPETLCDRCEAWASCLLDYDGAACRRNRTVEPTKADLVRSMSDPELATFITKLVGCPLNIMDDCPGNHQPSKTCDAFRSDKPLLCWTSWLQEPAEGKPYDW